MQSSKDSKYMKRCIAIANNGLGRTAPNPMVGCVIVCDDNIIGEGYTSPYGGPHAEVNAINSVSNKNLLKKSTLYVTLEPCSHYGQTPPCSNFITNHNIPKIVVGCEDPNKKVSGRGIAHLRANGAEVLVGVEENLCKAQLKRFLTFQTKKRPYIILKWAETADGFVAPKTKNSKNPFWISGNQSRQLVHQWRAEEQAILVGGKTVLEDNPSLTTRYVNGKNPIRIVIDKYNNLPQNSSVFNGEAKTLHLTFEILNSTKPIAKQICDHLYLENISSLIVEGGPKTLQYFIDEELWDEARIFKSNSVLGSGIEVPKFEKNSAYRTLIGEDTLHYFFNAELFNKNFID